MRQSRGAATSTPADETGHGWQLHGLLPCAVAVVEAARVPPCAVFGRGSIGEVRSVACFPRPVPAGSLSIPPPVAP